MFKTLCKFIKKNMRYIFAFGVICLGIGISYYESDPTVHKLTLWIFIKENPFTLIFSIITGFFSLIITEFRKNLKEAKNQIEKYISEISGKFEDISSHVDTHFKGCESRLGNIIEYFALGSGENGKFENLIEKVRNKGKIRWIVSKFISAKIQKDFEEGKGETELVISDVIMNDFIEFVSDIINDCDDTIFWTCPSLPQEWFYDALGRDLRIDENIEIEDFPFLRKLALASVKDKFRLVNLTQEKWENLIAKNDNNQKYNTEMYFLKLFIEINTSEGLKLYFVDLNKCLGKVSEDSVLTEDFGIYDNQVVISYKEEEKRLTLNLDIKEYNKLFRRVNAYAKNGEDVKGIYTPEQVISLKKEHNKR